MGNMPAPAPTSILGGGPAGSSAALAALAAGSSVRILEKSSLPRHKVCGEFLSPAVEPCLRRLRAWDQFQAAGPARIERMALHFSRRELFAPLPEPAWGLSRYVFDALLLGRARELGADIDDPSPAPQLVIATGRRSRPAPRGKRVFGFKAHFEGPPGDAVELFFFDGCYTGVSPVESRKTNVCGLGPEDVLRRFDFDYDQLVRRSPALAARLRPLTRLTQWLSTGPLDFRQSFDPQTGGVYPTGDAVSFADPFTGSGLLAAVRTGELAGHAAALRKPVTEYLAECRQTLRQPFLTAHVFRKTLDWGWAELMAEWIPAKVLFQLTRPRI